VGTTFVRQQKKSVYKNVTISLEGDMIRNNIHVSLEDEYCHTDLFGLYSPEGTEHMDNHTTVDHKYPNSTSNELYKGIIGDKATGVFNGSIFVRPNAQNTNAFQSNKNILLTGEATVHAKPQLEIWADDVKCSHGCTSGQIDEESLFYLRARGLSKNQARALLLKAFTTDVTREIEVESLREYVEKKLEKKLLKDVY
ncbi:MAG: SufD family Fe-S cluster assembly protein, partial [Cyclobacteriaceae bacterium]|nr:SufD family Fe-S cluster assembly protein [Cyclobacteriaceae bacterium]